MPLLRRVCGATGRAAHLLLLEIERLRADGNSSHAALARALTETGVPAPKGGTIWTHTTVARLLARTGQKRRAVGSYDDRSTASAAAQAT